MHSMPCVRCTPYTRLWSAAFLENMSLLERFQDWYRDNSNSLLYTCVMQEALLIGIPASALPTVTGDASLEELQVAREKMSGMIASFLSSGL